MDEMVGWHHQLDGHEFEQALGVGDGQGRLASCSPRGRKESDMTEHLGFPGGTNSKEPTCQCRRKKRSRLNPWLERFPGGGHGNILQYSCLENPMDGEA